MAEKSGGGWLARARKKSARSPQWRGALQIEGVEYQLSGWIREDKFKRPYLSIAVTKRPGQEGRRETDDT